MIWPPLEERKEAAERLNTHLSVINDRIKRGWDDWATRPVMTKSQVAKAAKSKSPWMKNFKLPGSPF
jgi:hypothetical protein